MRIGRRDFLKVSTRGLVGSVVGASVALTYLRTLLRGTPIAEAIGAIQGEEPLLQEHGWGFVFDATKCIGCGKCAQACKLENDVPHEPEYNRTWVERYVLTWDGETYVDSPNGGIDGFALPQANVKYQGLDIQKSFFVSKLCNQCENPPCVQVCPVAATYKTSDGVVLVDRKRCIGCRYCIQACPYGARFLDPRYHVADKCTWCYHRISKGLPPACVQACPVGARMFGDMKDPESTVRKALKDARLQVLKPSLGTRPQVYYIGLEKEVR